MPSLGLGLGVARRSRGLGVADPLAGIPSLLDLRTHKGDKVSFGISAEGSPSEWEDLLSGSGITATSASLPTSATETDGTPVLDFDDTSNNFLNVASFGGQVTYTILVKSNTPLWNTYFAFIDTVNNLGVSARWACLNAVSNVFVGSGLVANPPAGVRVNGVSVADPFPVPDPDEWNVITVKTNDSTVDHMRAIGQLENVYFMDARVIALFIHNGDPTTDRIEAVESYHQTLKPTP